jgi:hypothetical protein
MDLSRVDCLETWTIVTTDRLADTMRPLPQHVRLIAEKAFIGSGFRYEDLVGAVDVVITKPGYGILAECISTGAAMLYTSRGVFREYDPMVPDAAVRAQPVHQARRSPGWSLAESLEALMAQSPAAETMASMAPNTPRVRSRARRSRPRQDERNRKILETFAVRRPPMRRLFPAGSGPGRRP